MIAEEVQKQFIGRKTTFSTNGAGVIGYSYAKTTTKGT